MYALNINHDIPTAGEIVTMTLNGYSFYNSLRPHQIRGIEFLCQRMLANQGAILADEMGLGKTVQCILAIHVLLEYPKAAICSVLVVCPCTLLHNWAREFSKWLPEN